MDFVMYVGGSVWALDWCPQIHENPNSLVKCEVLPYFSPLFIAIAAHPPESYYHNLGAPLIGRGIIQIWCVLNVRVNDEEAVLSEKKPKHRYQNTGSKRPRGRHRKKPIDEPQPDQVKRPKGRSRNKSISESSNSDLNVQPLSVQYPEESFQFASVDNVPGNTEEDVPYKNHHKKQKGLKEAICTYDAIPKTSMWSKKLESKVQKKTNNDGKIQNEESEPSSAINQHFHFNPGLDATAPNNVLGCNLFEVSPSSSIPGDLALPRAVLYLAHNGRVAWDVKWKSYHINDSKCNQRLSYKRISIIILYNANRTQKFFKWVVLLPHLIHQIRWEVHLPNMVKNIYTSSPKQGTDPRFVKLDPVFKFSKLKCGDIQSDPFLPLWDVHPLPKFIYSLDWVPDPRCVMISFDYGTMRLLNLVPAACDVPISGKPFGANKQNQDCTWYCYVLSGELTSQAVGKRFSQNRTPHFACGSLTKEDSAVVVNTPLPDIPLPLKKPSIGCMIALLGCQLGIPSFFLNSQQLVESVAVLSEGNDPGTESEPEETLTALKRKIKQKSLAPNIEEATNKEEDETGKEVESKIETFPPMIVAMHRVRWNMNKGSERWLCYGGAAGIVRCQEIR
ncbi:DNA binding protein, putative isoform 2 [Hibiscus syriacus]|uniref:DNA binding protein, putative isoform 2 n=1 Tax=Hibiscus syriacus TaxID=106335 RepID=A0A6A2ZY49_HIBSY|nr:DNA binding protein, putative isoform 2 [Hibiscus syriacus]